MNLFFLPLPHGHFSAKTLNFFPKGVSPPTQLSSCCPSQLLSGAHGLIQPGASFCPFLLCGLAEPILASPVGASSREGGRRITQIISVPNTILLAQCGSAHSSLIQTNCKQM